MELTVEVSLTASERDLLLEILEERHRELLREISRAEHHDFKAELKGNATLIESMLSKLRTARPKELLVAS